MRILYAIQGTGNGHLSRAREIIPILQRKGELDLLISGTQADVDLPYPVKYRFKGLCFIFGKKGGVDVMATYRKSNLKRLYAEIKSVSDSVIRPLSFIKKPPGPKKKICLEKPFYTITLPFLFLTDFILQTTARKFSRLSSEAKSEIRPQKYNLITPCTCRLIQIKESSAYCRNSAMLNGRYSANTVRKPIAKEMYLFVR